jgi:ketosteroid isomerase-like protein
MKKLFIVIPLVFLLCFTFSCQQAEEVAEEPVVDVEADIAAIKGLLDEFEASLNVGDMEKLVSLNYAEEAVSFPFDQPMLRGKAEILSWFKKEAEPKTFQLDYVAENVHVEGDLAYMYGTASGTVTPKATGEPLGVKTKWMAVFKRQVDGSWKVVADSYHRSYPPPEKE